MTIARAAELACYTDSQLESMIDARRADIVKSGPRKGQVTIKSTRIMAAYYDELDARAAAARAARLEAAKGDRAALFAIWLQYGDTDALDALDILDALAARDATPAAPAPAFAVVAFDGHGEEIGRETAASEQAARATMEAYRARPVVYSCDVLDSTGAPIFGFANACGPGTGTNYRAESGDFVWG